MNKNTKNFLIVSVVVIAVYLVLFLVAAGIYYAISDYGFVDSMVFAMSGIISLGSSLTEPTNNNGQKYFAIFYVPVAFAIFLISLYILGEAATRVMLPAKA